jgi:hypothetical protein
MTQNDNLTKIFTFFQERSQWSIREQTKQKLDHHNINKNVYFFDDVKIYSRKNSTKKK